MADGKVVIQVEMDGNKAQSGVSKLKSLLGGLSESGARLGSVFKSVLGANLISGAVMSGVNALTGSIKGAFSTIISEGAALQQSIGGVETLFKGSAGKVKAYAEEAFRTAGLSANAYMENVTSFSASLLQSLGGDTEKAAEVANRAMIDMSDNANKMGTDIGRIQDAYQGFAKDNYTMLDNLKLGYGGTKTEMQRLIKDAAAMKDIQEELNVSVEDGNMSFGNIVNAISVMQKKLEITGTTAKEASSTLSGSFASMKAAWQNLAGKLALGMDIGPALKNLVSTASTFLLGNFLPMVGNIMRQLPKAISGALAEAGPQIEKGFKALFSSFGADPAIFNTIKDTFRDIVVTVETVFATLTNKANGFNDVISGVGNIIKLVNFAIQDLARAIQFALEAFAETDAINNAYKAFKDLTKAALDLAMKLSDVIPWDVVGAAAGHLVNAISTIISWISKLSQLISKDVWSGLITGIGGGVLAFKAFNFLQSFNPFNIFKRNAIEATSGAAEAITQGRSKIAQILSSLSSVIGSIGGAVKSAATGIGVGIKAALSGVSQVILAFGAALQTAGVANILAFGGAVATAAVGIGAGVAIIAAGFALLAAQGQGVATIINAVGEAFATVATAIIGAFAQAIVTVAGVLPIVTSALANLAPLIVAFGQAFGAAAPFVSALGEAITSIASVLPPVISAFSQGAAAIIEAVTPIVEIIGNVFTTVAQIVADAIVRIVQALAPFMPAVVQIAQALAPVLQSIAEAFTALVAQISPIIDSIANLFRTLGNVIRSVLDGAKGVIEGFGNAVRTILDGVSGIFDSIGRAALSAGQGFKLLAQGVGNIASKSAGLAQAGNAMKTLGVGMATVSSQANTAVSGLTNFATRITSVQTAVTALPSILASAASSFASFVGQVVSGIAGLSAINAPIAALRTQVTTITPALLQVATGLTQFSTVAMGLTTSLTSIGTAMTVLTTSMTTLATQLSMVTTAAQMAGAGLAVVSEQVMALASVFATVGASAMALSATIARLGMAISAGMMSAVQAVTAGSMQMSTALRSSGTRMVANSQAFMNQIVSAVKNSMNQIVSAVRTGGSRMVSAMQSSGQQLVAVTQAAVNQAAAAARAGYGAFFSAGSYMGQGLAAGLMSAFGAVTAAANALVAQAERAAQAKAKIHSPSHLFRDEVGWYIGLGIARGIDESAPEVANSLDYIREQVNGFNVRANAMLTGATSNMASQLKMEVLRDKTPDATISARQEAYAAHSASLLNDVIDALVDVKEQIAQGQNMVLDTGALVGGTVNNFNSAIDTIKTLKGRHRL